MTTRRRRKIRANQPAKRDTDLRPIQVFLDAKRFIETEEPRQRGGSKDFFEGNDRGFAAHKSRMTTTIGNVATALRTNKQSAGFISVRQREGALAKSHRPTGHLFSYSNQFALVGAERAGELLFQTTPAALVRLAGIIDSRAELKPRIVINPATGEREPRVSPYRSELGGIDEIRLYSASDKVKFSADEAVAWMRHPNAIGGYIVELFRLEREINYDALDRLVADFRRGLEQIRGGLLARPFLPSVPTAQFGLPSLTLSVQLTADNRRLIELPFLADGRPAEMSEASLPTEMRGVERDLTVARHAQLLAFFEEQGLVRSVELPPILETTPNVQGALAGQVEIPVPIENMDYPVVGIIDGGITAAPVVAQWKVGDAGLVPMSERDENHGTFIAGLVCAGSRLNPSLNAHLEPTGCKFYDLDLFPRYDLRGTYYPDIEDLFDTLDEKVKAAKRDFGARVFNLSFKIGERSSRLAYSLAADRLDRIARANDVIFVVAAGNLVSVSRPRWPKRSQDALAMLAGFSANDQITAPADHIFGLTVAAVNPYGIPNHEPLMPTTYTRRGPGVGGSRKPDLAHIGGVDGAAGNITGLISLIPSGDAVHNRGTSFAAPLTAVTVATLDQRLGRVAPRETLLALPIHRAKRPPELDKRALRHIAREFVGFGIPSVADDVLSDDPYSVTLVFSHRLLAKQRLEFPFAWPQSLVNDDGSCRGRAEVTLCFTPPVDPDHREEAIRVQLDATLDQEHLNEDTGETSWQSQLERDAADVAKGMGKTESYLIRTGLKWSPIKRYHLSMLTGRGNMSSWKLSLKSLVRAGVGFPSDGVAFTLVLTLSDFERTARIREEVRRDLKNQGFILADITVAHRVRPRAT